MYVVILFLIVPINRAIDYAPNHLLTIHETILVFITAAITYNLYFGRKDTTILDQLAKANTERMEKCQLEDREPTPQPGNERPANQPGSEPPTTQPEDSQTQLSAKAWKSKHKSDQQLEMAKLLLDALLALKQQGNTNP